MTRTQQNYIVAKFFLRTYSTAFQRILKRIEDFNKILVTLLSLLIFDVEISTMIKKYHWFLLRINS